MLKALIIDDEEDARESLRLLIGKFCPQVELVGIHDGPVSGLKGIRNTDPDLVFLDVQMPHMSGFDMLAELEDISFQTVFVTAHDQYAIKAIRFSALDYLMKPVDVDELLSAVSKAQRLDSVGNENEYQGILNNVRNRLGQDGKLAVPSAEGMEFIDIRDIIFCEADGSYTKLHMDGGKVMLISKNLKEFEQILDPQNYCRVHHSFLINLGHIERYVKGEGGYAIMSNGGKVDISRRRKEAFMKQIDRL